jgi:hypothetical protein
MNSRVDMYGSMNGGELYFTMGADIVVGIGLLLTFIGAAITAKAVILTEDDAIRIGVSRFAGETREQNLALPTVQNLLASSRAARTGLLTIVVGTGLQLAPIIGKFLIWTIG